MSPEGIAFDTRFRKPASGVLACGALDAIVLDNSRFCPASVMVRADA